MADHHGAEPVEGSEDLGGPGGLGALGGADADRLYSEAAEVLARLRAGRHTLVVAESLTGGLLAATLTAVPGASLVFRGGVCAYATDVKESLLGVPHSLVDSAGVVSAPAAEAMARGARERLGATYALSTTGVAGPDPQEGKAVGTVFVGVSGPEGEDTTQLRLPGDRQAVREGSCLAALGLLRRNVGVGGTPADR
jgi:PncC family amidohydrolase